MKKTTAYYDSRDGLSKIYAVTYNPEEEALVDGKPRAILQIIHGMTEYVERYEKLAQFLTDRGFVVVGEDHLGHGKTVTQDGTYGYFCKQDPATVVVRDVHRLKKMTQKQYPGVPYFILGHSMGSFILRNYMTKYGTGIQGALVMGTGTIPGALLGCASLAVHIQGLFMGGRHKCEALSKNMFGTYNNRIPDHKTPNDWLSKNEENVAKYQADKLCGFTFTVNGFETLFELVKRASNPKNIANIPTSLPVLLQSGTEDPVGQYGEGVKAVRDALLQAGLTDVECKLYEGDRHEIINEADGDRVMEDLYQWILSKLPE